MTELIYTLICTHLTIMCFSLYIHRGQAHGSIIFHPILSHLMRAWIWLTSGVHVKTWRLLHRKHHKFADKEGDPHSPQIHGLGTLIFKGAILYFKSIRPHRGLSINLRHHFNNKHKIAQKLGITLEEDWIERNVYTPYPCVGLLVILIINALIFGWWGFAIWFVQLMLIPFFTTALINGVSHYAGYRNWNTDDCSHNLSPIGIIMCGEEMHNNHHKYPRKFKLSHKWWEFDLGYVWFKLFNIVGLAKLGYTE